MPTRIGELMAAAGYATSGPELRGPRGWLGSLPEVEQRIKKLSKQRAAAHAALDEALLDDDARAKRDAESAELREAFNTMHVTSSADGVSLVAYKKDDGSVLELSAMTPKQRTAFERMDALHRQHREPEPVAT
jgi:hypothetical protein